MISDRLTNLSALFPQIVPTSLFFWLLAWIPARRIRCCGGNIQMDYKYTHGVQKSCGGKGMAWPLSK